MLLFLSNLRAWFHTKNFLSTSSPESYFHLGLRLLFSLLHYLLEFICDHFRRECLSSCTAQVHAHLHVCTVKNNLPVTGSLRPPPQDFLLRIQLLRYFCDMSVVHDHCAIKAEIIKKKKTKASLLRRYSTLNPAITKESFDR